MPTLNAAIDARGAMAGAAQFDQASKKVQNSARKADAAVEKLDKKMTIMERTGRFLRKSLLLVSGAFLGFQILGGITRLVASFEEQMATIKAITDATAESMSALTEEARKLGATTRFTATEVASAMVTLTRAGYETNEVLRMTADVLNLSVAGFVDLERAADITASTIAQFGLSVAETERVADVFVNTASSTQSQVSELSETMKFAGAVAGNLGISLEETAAAAGVLADNNIRASLAGTNLRGIIGTLLNPSKEALTIFEQMGYTADQLSPAFNDLATIFQRLKDASMTEAEAGEIFKKRNFTASLILTNNVDALRQLTEENANAQGTAAEFAAVVDDTLIGSIRSLVSSFQELLLVVGNSESGIGGQFRNLIDMFTDFFRITSGVENAWAKATTAGRILTATLQGLVVATSAWIALRLGAYLVGVAQKFTTLRAAAIGLHAVIMANPFAAAATALGALVAAMVLFSRQADKLSADSLKSVEAIADMSVYVDGMTDAVNRFNVALRNLDENTAIEARRAAAEDLRNTIISLENAGNRIPAGSIADPGTFMSTARDPQQYQQAYERYQQRRQAFDNSSGLIEVPQQIRDTENALVALMGEQGRFINQLTAIRTVQEGGLLSTDIKRSYIDRAQLTQLLEDRLRSLEGITSDQVDAQEELEEQLRQTVDDFREQEKAVLNLGQFMEDLRIESVTSQMSDMDAAIYRANLEIALMGRAAGYTGQEIVTYQERAEDMIRAMFDFRDAQEEAEDAAKNLERQLRKNAQAIAGATEAISDALFEQSLIGRGDSFGNIESQVREFEKNLGGAGGPFGNILTQTYRSIVTENQRLLDEETKVEAERERLSQLAQNRAERRKSARSDLREMFTDLKTEQQLVGMTVQQREKELFMMQARNSLAASGLPFQDIVLRNLEKEFDELQRLEYIEKISDQVGESFTRMFEDVILGAQSASEALEGFARSLLNIFFQQAVGSVFATMATNFTSGILGNFIGGAPGTTQYNTPQRVQTFATGGVVGSPTYFSMAGGTGLMGEAGPEAILPLERGPDGRLGVSASGEAGMTVNHFHFPPGTDVASFKRSARQISDKISKPGSRVRRLG